MATKKRSEQTALERYHASMDDEGLYEPLERLRFFCSCAMTGQDWLDVERFFDDVRAELEAARAKR